MTVEAKRYSAVGEIVGAVALPDNAFGQRVNTHILWEATRCFLANQRQGTAKVKTRSEVAYSGKKPWRQKGTGRARSGTRGSPVWVGGGRAFGPKPRDYGYELPRRVRRAAIVSALSQKASEGAVFVVDAISLPEPKTKLIVSLLERMGLGGKKCLLVVPESDPILTRCSRNIPRVRTRIATALTAYEVVDCDAVILAGESASRIEEVYAR
jgi:large subunit ribosomal protein L4